MKDSISSIFISDKIYLFGNNYLYIAGFDEVKNVFVEKYFSYDYYGRLLDFDVNDDYIGIGMGDGLALLDTNLSLLDYKYSDNAISRVALGKKYLYALKKYNFIEGYDISDPTKIQSTKKTDECDCRGDLVLFNNNLYTIDDDSDFLLKIDINTMQKENITEFHGNSKMIPYNNKLYMNGYQNYYNYAVFEFNNKFSNKFVSDSYSSSDLHFTINDDLLYLESYHTTILIYNIKNKKKIGEIGAMAYPYDLVDIVAQGNYLFVARSYQDDIVVLDTHKLDSIRQIKVLEGFNNIRKLIIKDGYLYILCDSYIYKIDIGKIL